ncbi:MAG: recombinase family protein [Candidatus Eisenbacteria bacterium]
MGRRRRQKRAAARAAVLYVRCSLEEQAIDGYSVDYQEASLRAYCALRGLEVTEVVVDAGASGGKPLASREGGATVQNLAARGKVGAVVGWKLDRLFRDAGDCLNVTREWDRWGVALHLADLGGQAVDTSSAMGRFFLTVMAGAAEMERNQIRERTAAALRHKAANGEFCGGEVPYGFRIASDGVRLAEVEEEQQVIREARRLRASGLSLRAVARELDRFGYASRSGRPFAASQVARMTEAAATKPTEGPIGAEEPSIAPS